MIRRVRVEDDARPQSVGLERTAQGDDLLSDHAHRGRLVRRRLHPQRPCVARVGKDLHVPDVVSFGERELIERAVHAARLVVLEREAEEAVLRRAVLEARDERPLDVQRFEGLRRARYEARDFGEIRVRVSRRHLPAARGQRRPRIRRIDRLDRPHPVQGALMSGSSVTGLSGNCTSRLSVHIASNELALWPTSGSAGLEDLRGGQSGVVAKKRLQSAARTSSGSADAPSCSRAPFPPVRPGTSWP